ncbi:hypothetical protein FN846DRAFT_663357 [Sphaerosporella brunnea]|uniref:Uncharacterized protein n=1 Tax=Sphaerosporella brunnea TaxID=1250544 RepID=A0A5J5EZI6_9PEZI|nr:hypothetical protein FN846DRAFT_663357 [Sphaerosporella brunnea]
MPLIHHDRTVPTTRRSRSVRSEPRGNGYSHSHPRTAPSTVGPVRSVTPPMTTTATKPSLLTRLKHGGATTATSRPQLYHADSYGGQTTAATTNGPTSHVPRHARGYAAPAPTTAMRQPPTVGDRVHGAAKRVVGTLMLDRNKRAEGRVMEMGGAPAPVQPVRETTVPSVGGGRRRHSHGTRNYY